MKANEEWKTKMIEKLEAVRSLVEDSEKNMRTAVISYRKYQEDLRMASEKLDELQEEIDRVKARSIFDVWFGCPIEGLDKLFNSKVHDAIEEVQDVDDN